MARPYLRYSKYSIENPRVWEYCQEPNSKDDVRFLIRLFKKFGSVRSVLDVGCGVGSHVKHLADKGYVAEGVEADPAKVAYCKQRFPELRFRQQRMQTLQTGTRYDAIICIHSTIAFNQNNAEVLGTFRAFHAHLKRGGLLLVQVKNSMGLITNPPPWRRIDAGPDRIAMGVHAVVEDMIDVTTQRLTSTRTFFRLTDGKKVGRHMKSSRLYFPEELAFFLEQAGLRVVGRYGGELSTMTLRDTTLDKPDMLFVAKRR